MKEWGRYVHDSHLLGRGTDIGLGHREVEKANEVGDKSIISVEHRDNFASGTIICKFSENTKLANEMGRNMLRAYSDFSLPYSFNFEMFFLILPPAIDCHLQ